MRNLQLAATLMALVVPSLASAEPADVAAAVAATADRSENNVKLDESRKPVELLNFLGLQKGMVVGDPFGGNLYWAQITSRAVGPNGQVIIWEPTQFNSDKVKEGWTAFAATHPNTVMLTSPMQDPRIGTALYDFMLINMDYHDVYWSSEKYGIPTMNPDAWTKAVFDAMKPGGIVGIVDHRALPSDDTRKTVEAYHRIDPAVVKADFARAGFVLEGESDMLANPADPHNVGVFDPSIRGKTDRFVLKFRKPQ